MKIYYLNKLEKPLELTNTIKRYQKTMINELFYDNNCRYKYLGYSYELNEEKGSGESHTIVVLNMDESVADAMKIVRGSSTYVANDSNSFEDGKGRYFFDGLNGFAVVQKRSDALKSPLSDYVLMLAYSNKINEFIELGSKNELKEIYEFDVNIYFENPLSLTAYSGRQMWQCIAWCAGIKERHDEMLRQCKALLSLKNAEQYQASANKQNIITIILAILTLFVAIASFPVIAQMISKFLSL